MSSSHPFPSASSPRASRRRRSLGAAMVEYSLLLTFIAIPAIVGFTAGGVILFRTYVHARNHLMLPTP